MLIKNSYKDSSSSGMARGPKELPPPSPFACLTADSSLSLKGEGKIVNPFFKGGLLQLAGILSLFLFCSTTFANPVLPFQHWQTTKGTPVYFVRTTELPMADISIIVDAGSSRDGAQQGIAQFTNELLSTGTKTLSVDQIADQFDSVGALFQSGVGRDKATLSLRSLTRADLFNPALKTFTEILSHPAFPADQFKLTTAQTLQAIRAEQQSPGAIISRLFYSTLYGNQPYAHASIGTQKTVPTITQKNVLTFYNRYYTAKNMIIVLVGNLDRKQAEKIANQLTQNIPSGSHAPQLPLSEALHQALQKHQAFPSTQTHIMIGSLGINRKDPYYFSLLVGNEILGGGPLTSRLFKEIRDTRGLAYSAYSGFSRLREKGPFIIGIQTRNEQAKTAIQVAKKTLDQFIQKGPSEQELISAKRSIIGSFPLGLASNSAIVANLSSIAFYDLPLDYLDTFRDKIKAVTRKQIHHAFQQRINPNHLITVTVGP